MADGFRLVVTGGTVPLGKVRIRKAAPLPEGGGTPPVGQPTGRFHTEGRRIIDPQGYEFAPRGVNVGGTIANNNNGWPDLALNASYIQGQADKGANAVRIVMYVTSRMPWSQWGNKYPSSLYAADHNTRPTRDPVKDAAAIAAIDKLADDLTAAYRAKGLVVIMETHDLTQSGGLYGADGKLSADGRTWITEINDFWRRYAGRWKHDTGVWFNIANEPNLKAPEWQAFHDDALGVIRSEVVADNVVVADLLYYASDLGKYGSASTSETFPRGYEPSMLPALITKYGNVVGSQHNYGSHGLFVNEANIRSYYTKYRDADIPLMVGEVGFPNPGYGSNIGNWQWEHDAAVYAMSVAVEFNIGVMWWASNFNDAYRLYDMQGSTAIKNEFNPATVLTEAGTKFFAYLSAMAAKGIR